MANNGDSLETIQLPSVRTELRHLAGNSVVLSSVGEGCTGGKGVLGENSSEGLCTGARWVYGRDSISMH